MGRSYRSPRRPKSKPVFRRVWKARGFTPTLERLESRVVLDYTVSFAGDVLSILAEAGDVNKLTVEYNAAESRYELTDLNGVLFNAAAFPVNAGGVDVTTPTGDPEATLWIPVGFFTADPDNRLVDVQLGDGDDAFDVVSVFAATHRWKVDGGAGDDAITIGAATTIDVYGGGDDDKIYIQAAATGDVYGGDGKDEIHLEAALTGSVDAGAGDDLIRFMNAGSVSGDVVGGDGDDTLRGDDNGNDFVVDAADQGTLAEKIGGTWSSIENLQGGDGADRFTISDAATLTGSIDGGAGDDLLDFSLYTSFQTFTLNAAGASGAGGATTPIGGGFASIDALVGTQGDDLFEVDEDVEVDLYGYGGGDKFVIHAGKTLTGDVYGDQGDVAPAAGDLETEGGDHIVFGDGARVLGLVDGEGGEDLLDFSLYAGALHIVVTGNSAVASEGGKGTVHYWNHPGDGASRIDGGFFGMNHVSGGHGGDLSDCQGNDLFEVVESAAVNLYGHAGNDTFVIHAGKTLTGNVFGDDGNLDIRNNATYAGASDGRIDWEYNETALNGGKAGEGDDHVVFRNGAVVVGQVHGEGGDDLLDFSPYASGLTFALTAGSSGTVGPIGGGFSSFRYISGGSGNDVFTVGPGYTAAVSLFGQGGNDRITVSASLAGDLVGGAGNDTITLSAGVQWTGSIYAGGGNDKVVLGANSVLDGDVWGDSDLALDVRDNECFDTAPDGLTDWDAPGAAGAAGGDHIVFGDGARVLGLVDGEGGEDLLDFSLYAGALHIVVTGNSAVASEGAVGTVHEWIHGLPGENADSRISGGFFGVNHISGGQANDLFEVVERAAVNLYGHAGNDTFVIDRNTTLTGSVFGDDGDLDIRNNATYAGASDGRIDWEYNETALNGGKAGEGDDHFVFGDGARVLGHVDGEGHLPTSQGGDLLDFSDFTTSLSFTLDGNSTPASEGAKGTVGPIDGGFFGMDKISGGRADDLFEVKESSDANLYGHGGNDRFVVGAGVTINGSLFGDDGELDERDFATFETKASPADGLIDWVEGQAVYSDAVCDGPLANDDVFEIHGRVAGSVFGEEGNDRIEFGDEGRVDGDVWGGSHRLVTDDAGNVICEWGDTLSGGPTSDDVFEIDAFDEGRLLEKIGGRWYEIENLEGRGGDDEFRIMTPWASIGTIDGGDGNDTLDYSNLTLANFPDLDRCDLSVEVDLENGAASNVRGPVDGTPPKPAYSIEIVVGGDGCDILIGDDGPNLLIGGGGDDTISGAGGADTIFGGSGSDELFGGEGDDEIHGDDGDDSIIGGAGNDVLRGGDGDDTLEGEAGDDTIFAGLGFDVVDQRSSLPGDKDVLEKEGPIEPVILTGGGSLQKPPNFGFNFRFQPSSSKEGYNAFRDIVTFAGADAAFQYVNGMLLGLYCDLLGRAPTSLERQYWFKYLSGSLGKGSHPSSSFALIRHFLAGIKVAGPFAPAGQNNTYAKHMADFLNQALIYSKLKPLTNAQRKKFVSLLNQYHRPEVAARMVLGASIANSSRLRMNLAKVWIHKFLGADLKNIGGNKDIQKIYNDVLIILNTRGTWRQGMERIFNTLTYARFASGEAADGFDRGKAEGDRLAKPDYGKNKPCAGLGGGEPCNCGEGAHLKRVDKLFGLAAPGDANFEYNKFGGKEKHLVGADGKDYFILESGLLCRGTSLTNFVALVNVGKDAYNDPLLLSEACKGLAVDLALECGCGVALDA